MLINEVAKLCNLTKKAVEYYTEQGLISPNILENGYRDFSEQDMEILKKIGLFRRLGLSIFEIKSVLANPDELKSILYKKTLELEQEKMNSIIQAKDENIKNIDEFIRKNKEVLDQYNEYKKTEEFKNSPTNRLMELMKQVCATNGYYEKFIPAMRKLSPLYNEHYEQMIKANEQFIKNYPQYTE